MSFRKELFLLLAEIRAQLRGIRLEAERQTELMATPIDLVKAEANDHKEITWQEAVETLRDLCDAQRHCGSCPAKAWCDYALPLNRSVISPGNWEVPDNE